MEAHLAALAAGPDAPDRDARIARARRLPAAAGAAAARGMRPRDRAARALLEAMTRRYYRDPHARAARASRAARRRAARARRPTSATARRRHVAATLGEPDDAGRGAARARGARRDAARRASSLLADFYARTRRGTRRAELGCATRSTAALPATRCTASSSVRAPERGRGMSAMRPSRSATAPTGSSRTRSLRGLHPMMAERLRRCGGSREFELERLPSAEDVYLFRGVARANPKDERLFALAEVRDLTPVRDEDGRVTALPELERMRASRRSRRCAPFQAPPPAARSACTGTACCSTSGRRSSSRRPRPRARHRAASRRTTAGLGLEMVALARRTARRDGVERDRVLRLFSPGRARASSSRSTTRRPSRCSRSTRAPADRRRAPARARCTRPRSSSCSRPRAAQPASAIPAGDFVEHDLDERRPRSCRSTARRAPTRREHRGRAGPQPHRALPGGHAARRRCSATRRARSARSPSRSAGAIIAALDLAERARRAGRVVRAVRRARRSRWTPAPRTWTGSPRCCAGSSSFTQARRRDQRRRDRHQRRRPAVLERRGDDAHAHARASS